MILVFPQVQILCRPFLGTGHHNSARQGIQFKQSSGEGIGQRSGIAKFQNSGYSILDDKRRNGQPL